MNYSEVLEYLFNSLPMYQRQGKSAYKANLDNTIVLDKHFDSPHNHYPSVHIAGTNGKGSVAHIIASVFQQAGYKTGLYTSPHLYDFRERIKIDGIKISEEFICSFVNENIKFLKRINPSFFEMSVALAFEYFRSQNIDIAIIETGMGGRLDSTNIITPELSVITNIGLDHTYFLGNTISKIANEKAGIIKRNVPVIIGEKNPESESVFIEKAKENNAPIVFTEDNTSIRVAKNEYSIITSTDTYSFKPDLKGNYQQKNYCTALVGIEMLFEKFPKLTKSTTINGFESVIKNTGLHGRWEILKENPKVICDTAHNKEGLRLVINQLLQLKYKELHIVLGFVNDKNIEDILKLFPKQANYYFTQADIPRALNVNILKNKALKLGFSGESFDCVKSAYDNVLTKSEKSDIIFIGGSTFVVGDFLKYFFQN